MKGNSSETETGRTSLLTAAEQIKEHVPKLARSPLKSTKGKYKIKDPKICTFFFNKRRCFGQFTCTSINSMRP